MSKDLSPTCGKEIDLLLTAADLGYITIRA